MSQYKLNEVFVQVEAHVMPLIGGDSPHGLTKEENKVIAFQNVNRLNQRIGYLARESSENVGMMRILQSYVNSLTMGLKSDNAKQVRSAMASIRNMIKTLEPDEVK